MRPVEVEVQVFCEDPNSSKLTIKQVKALLLGQARKFLGLVRDNENQITEPAVDKTYQKPALRQITLEQAKLILVGRATLGDKGARELMEVVFDAPGTQPWRSLHGAAAAYSPEIHGRRPAPDCP